MKFAYKIDVLDALREKGYTTFVLRKKRMLSESTIQKLRNNVIISLEQIGVVCDLLDVTPWDLVECYHDTPEELHE